MSAAAFRRVVDHLNTRFLGREQEIHTAMLCLLSSQNHFMMGPPGTGKTTFIKQLAQQFGGMRFFKLAFDQQTTKDEYLGPWDMARFRDHGEWARISAGRLPEAHIAFLDELDKTLPFSTDSLLALIEEQEYNGETVPLISTFGAGNYSPASAALWDRFLVRHQVDYLTEVADLQALLRLQDVQTEQEMLTLEQLLDAQWQVREVRLGEDIEKRLIAMRNLLASEHQLPVSDRRLRASTQLLRAEAWLAGAGEVEPAHLMVLQHSWWHGPGEIPIVRRRAAEAADDDARVQIEIGLADLSRRAHEADTLSATARDKFVKESLGILKDLEAQIVAVGADRRILDDLRAYIRRMS